MVAAEHTYMQDGTGGTKTRQQGTAAAGKARRGCRKRPQRGETRRQQDNRTTGVAGERRGADCAGRMYVCGYAVAAAGNGASGAARNGRLDRRPRTDDSGNAQKSDTRDTWGALGLTASPRRRWNAAAGKSMAVCLVRCGAVHANGATSARGGKARTRRQVGGEGTSPPKRAS